MARKRKGETSITQAEFLSRVWKRLDNYRSREELKKYYNAICDELQQALKEESVITLNGIGTFSIERSSPKRIKHVLTGELMYTRGKKSVKFTSSSQLKKHFDQEASQESEEDN